MSVYITRRHAVLPHWAGGHFDRYKSPYFTVSFTAVVTAHSCFNVPVPHSSPHRRSRLGSVQCKVLLIPHCTGRLGHMDKAVHGSLLQEAECRPRRKKNPTGWPCEGRNGWIPLCFRPIIILITPMKPVIPPVKNPLQNPAPRKCSTSENSASSLRNHRWALVLSLNVGISMMHRTAPTSSLLFPGGNW